MSAEEQIAKAIGDAVLRGMNDREGILQMLFSAMMDAKKAQKGLPKFIEAIEDGKTRPDQLGQMISQLCKIVGSQAEIISVVCMIAAVYVSSDTFLGDSSKAAIKVGRGEEALRAMAQAKFGHLRRD